MTPYLEEKQTPTVIIKRKEDLADTEWYVHSDHVQIGGSASWSTVGECTLVRVPLFSYATVDPTPESLYGFAIQIGADLVSKLPYTDTNNLTLFLALGNVFKNAQGNFQFWVGIAFKRDKR